MELRIAGTVGESIVDGPGFRFTIFTQGCPHGCEGCHNPQTHDFNGGIVVDTDQLYNEIIKDPLLDGVTFSEKPRNAFILPASSANGLH